jgi:hypothetical protein
MNSEIRPRHPRIHTREIRLHTFPHENNQILVHGELLDTRHIPVFDITGEVRPPGPIHHLHLYCLVAGDPLRIVAASGEMPCIPLPDCATTLDRVPLLEGLFIKSGFTRQAGGIMGGSQGCTHLSTLIKAMAQEFVHGWLTWKRREKTAVPRSLNEVPERHFLIDSCRLWARGGPKLTELESAIRKASKAPTPDTTTADCPVSPEKQ